MKNLLIVLCITVLVSGCADTVRITQDPNYGHVTLPTSATAYVSVPRDGQYETKTYRGSGLSVTTIIRSSLLMHLVQVDQGFEVESFTQAIKSAKSNSVDYLFFPTILHWEDRATEWSGIPDRAQVKVVIVDIKTSEVISSAIIDGKSGVATLGGDHPQDLLPKPVAQFIDGLFK